MGDLHWAFFVENEIVNGYAIWRNPEIEGRWDATQASAAGEVDAATFDWAAEERSHFSGQESAGDEEQIQGGSVSAAK